MEAVGHTIPVWMLEGLETEQLGWAMLALHAYMIDHR